MELLLNVYASQKVPAMPCCISSCHTCSASKGAAQDCAQCYGSCRTLCVRQLHCQCLECRIEVQLQCRRGEPLQISWGT